METAEAGCAGIDYAIILRTAGEGYASSGLQGDHEIVRWTRPDVGNAEANRYIFARIDNAVARLTTFSGKRSAAVAKHGQLPSGNTDFPNAPTVSGCPQVALHVGNLH